MGGIACGTQVTICDYPVHFDTYTGCSHGCRYCFAQTKVDIGKIKVHNCDEQLRRFVSGGRTSETSWCDFPIPLHWGGLSDPFQPAESHRGGGLR